MKKPWPIHRVAGAAAALVFVAVVWAALGLPPFGSNGREAEFKSLDEQEAPLFEEGDEPLTVRYWALSRKDGRPVEAELVIRKSREPLNRLKQAVRAYLEREGGEVYAPAPPGAHLREIYLLADGTAVIDFELPAVPQRAFGFLEEAVFQKAVETLLTENFREVRRVRFLRDGGAGETWGGHWALERGGTAGP